MPKQSEATERLTTYVKPVHKELVMKLATEQKTSESEVVRRIVAYHFDMSMHVDLSTQLESV